MGQDPVYSGPQVGEPLPSFKIQGVSGDQVDKELDPVGDAQGQPILLVFVHELTRPGFGLMKAVTQYASTRPDPKMKVAVIFLTDDPTATKRWASNVERLLSPKITYGLSLEGKEGPGSYGLNRNVTLTVLVAKEGKVTGNYALVQPQLQADGPKILKSIVDVTGGGKVPAIEELAGNQMRRERDRRAMRTRPT
ncbi:MAG: hypothetical protein MI861_16035, partial [Pirellulales bacterium]|nr:hypothetical protein [Pirellulales bacterium]